MANSEEKPDILQASLPTRDAKGKFVPGSVVAGRPFGWRSAVRALLGPRLDGIWSGLATIAEGQPLICRHPDGRQLAIVPTAADVIRAGTEILHMMVGKPVDQTEIVRAELAATAQEGLRQLSDEDLKARIIERLQAEGWAGPRLAGGDAKPMPDAGQGGGTGLAPDRLQGPPSKLK